MAKARISSKRKRFLQESKQFDLKKLSKVQGSGVHKSKDPLKFLLDEDNIGKAILECLLHNDPEGVVEVIQMYLSALNTSKFLEEANISRATVYSTFKNKNPTIKTLARIMHASTLNKP